MTTTSNTTTPSSISAFRELLDRLRHLYQAPETRGKGSRVPHPGDILYWVGCVGAASALLFVATR